jgi:putative hydrolase of the HAD superfamily
MVAVLKIPYKDFRKIWTQTAPQRAIGQFRTLAENLRFICDELKVDVNDRQIDEAVNIRFAFIARVLTPREDAIETLSQLKSNKYKLGLVSNCSPEPPVLWPRTPFAPFFDTAIFSSTAGLQKPDPAIYLMAVNQLSVKPKECLYIGDGDNQELSGAAEVGMNPVLISAYREGIEIIRNNPETQWQGPVISSLKEVLNLVK